jgi:hypothetical protein
LAALVVPSDIPTKIEYALVAVDNAVSIIMYASICMPSPPVVLFGLIEQFSSCVWLRSVAVVCPVKLMPPTPRIKDINAVVVAVIVGAPEPIVFVQFNAPVVLVAVAPTVPTKSSKSSGHASADFDCISVFHPFGDTFLMVD